LSGESTKKSDEEILQKTEAPSFYVRKSSGLIRGISGRNALFSNLIAMGLLANCFWIVFASALYPNADLPSTVFIALVLNLLIAFVYWILSTAMPRTGGDYIYVGRIVHPIVGFMTNAMFVVMMVSWSGIMPAYTAQYALQIMYTNLAAVTGNSYYAGVATWLTTQSAIFTIGAIIVTAIVLLMFCPVKWIFRVIVGIFVGQAVIFVALIALLLSTSNATFSANFAAQSGTTVQALIGAAKSSGVIFNITLGGTVLGIVYTMLSYIGYANSAYFAGEIQGDPKKSQGIAIVASTAVFSVLIYILYASIYNVFGHDFLVAASTLATSGNPAWASVTSAFPSPAFLVVYLTHNPILVAAVPLGMALTFIGFGLAYFFIPVRNIFAWAFDRVIPVKFAEVNRRGVPWVAIIFYAVIAYLSLYAAVYTPLFSYFSYSNFGWWLAVAIVCFSAAIFPWRRKDIFQSSPNVVRWKIGGLPVIALVGFVAGALSLYVSIATTLPGYTGIPLNPVYVMSMLAIFVLAGVIYLVSYYYHKSKGMPLGVISKELPPV
jgi:amino acid transporter